MSPPSDQPGASAAVVLPTLRADGAARPLTRAQRKFNQLIERLNLQRRELADWQAYRLHYQQQLAERYQPLATRLREKRIALVQLFARSMERDGLSKRDRDKVRDILVQSAVELLDEAFDPELGEIHDRYAAVGYAEKRRDDMAVLRAMAREEFGVDAAAYVGDDTPEDLADWLKEQIRAARPAGPDTKSRPGDGAGARAALREQAVEGGTRAVREVYRKLASELHPDRATDPAEQVRKTALMQRVNQAYKTGDLLALLELQLSIEQIDAAALSGLAEERLKRYIFVLEEQARRLRDELSELVEPFVRVVGDASARAVTPEAVQRVLEADLRNLKELVRGVESELLQFRDVRQLKQSLAQYRINGPEPAGEPPPRRRRG